MTTGKIISFEDAKKRIEEASYYIGSITIFIEGKSFEKSVYNYYLEYLETEDLEEALEDVFESLSKNVDISNIYESTSTLLNRDITINYYLPKTKNKGIYFYDYEPDDLTETQLFVILAFCIINLKKQYL